MFYYNTYICIQIHTFQTHTFMSRYIVDIEEDNGSYWIIGIVFCALIIVGIIFIGIYIGIPALIIYLIYKLIKWIRKKNAENKIAQKTKCMQCGKRSALRDFRTDLINETPIEQTIYSKNGQTSTIKITKYTYRHYEKCIYCGSITYSDEITDTKK